MINYNLREPITKNSFPSALISDSDQIPLAEDYREFKYSKRNWYFRNSAIDHFQLKVFSQILGIPFVQFIDRHQKYVRFNRNIKRITSALLPGIISVSTFFIIRSFNVIKRSDRDKSLETFHTWVEEIRNYKNAGITDVKRSRDSAMKYFQKYPGDPAFIKEKKVLDSLLQ